MIALAEARVIVDLRNRLARLKHLLETKQVSVNPLAIRSPSSIGKMLLDSSAEEIVTSDILSCNPVRNNPEEEKKEVWGKFTYIDFRV